MDSRSQLDLMISSLVLIRKTSSAIDAALALPAADRAKLESILDQVRGDLGQVVGQVGSAIPGASGIVKRPEIKAVAGVIEFVARQSANQLGAVAGVADALRSGEDSRALANRIDLHLRSAGVSTREEIGAALRVDPAEPRLQEALERLLGSGRAEWYGPGVYGVPRGQLEELSDLGPRAVAEDGDDRGGVAIDPPRHLAGAVNALEGSLGALAAALSDADRAERTPAERIRELRQLADEGIISSAEFERRKRDLLGQI